jgi:hypothetical protein
LNAKRDYDRITLLAVIGTLLPYMPSQHSLALRYVAIAALNICSLVPAVGHALLETAGDRRNANDCQGFRNDASEAEPCPVINEERLEDAWWTGPMVAASAETVPAEHVLIEPYFFDVHSTRHDQITNLNYLLYGVTAGVSAGAIVTEADVLQPHDRSLAGFRLADVALLGQIRLTHFTPEKPIPTISLIFQESLPTGRYDELGQRAANALGTGGYATSAGVYFQDYVWLPNGHILRPRLDLLETFPQSATLNNRSVYGTPEGFSGQAKPGRSFTADLAAEYSINREWVLACDAVYHRSAATRVIGRVEVDGSLTPLSTLIGAQVGMSYAPAVEYNFSSNLGILLGVRLTRPSLGSPRLTTPVVAINWIL